MEPKERHFVRVDSLSPMMTRSLMAALPRMPSTFPVAEEAPVHGQATAAAPGPATSVEMLVTLGATGSPVERRRLMARQAPRGLESLERLHAELLTGTVAPARLREIAAWSASLETSEDATLATIQSENNLRVRVELSKFDIEA